MAFENSGVVDAAGIDRDSGDIVLSIIDTWDWIDQVGHLTALQAKLNSYFDYVESGQVFENYPGPKAGVRIDIISRFPLPPCGQLFLQKASGVASTLDISIAQLDHFCV